MIAFRWYSNQKNIKLSRKFEKIYVCVVYTAKNSVVFLEVILLHFCKVISFKNLYLQKCSRFANNWKSRFWKRWLYHYKDFKDYWDRIAPRKYDSYNIVPVVVCVIFAVKPFCYMTKKSRQKLKYLENEKSSWRKIKSIFYNF